MIKFPPVSKKPTVGRKMQRNATKRVLIMVAQLFVVYPFVLYLCVIALIRLLKVREEIAALIVLGLALVFGAVFFRYQDVRLKRSTQRTQQFVTSKGMAVEEKTRHITFFDAEEGVYEEAPVTGYAVRNSFQKKSTWSLLIPGSQEGDFPNGWKLIVEDGEVSGPTRQLIAEIASNIAADDQLSKAYFEIESYPDRVVGFWDEAADLRMAQKAYDILLRVSGATE